VNQRQSRRAAKVWIAGAAALLSLSAVKVRGQELATPPRDLIYSSLDLKYASLDLTTGADGLAAGGKSTGASGSGLQTQVTDLKAAGADVKETEKEIQISLQGEILFDFDKADLRPAAESTLSQIATLIGKYPKAQTLIEGYTDSKGSDTYNAKLSDRRANAVKSWLASHGIKAASLQAHGRGASKPVAPNKHPDGSDDPEGRQKNRRVEITIQK
jgi:outer membrane protein OmpA-like peptidoglycan-associated protein